MKSKLIPIITIISTLGLVACGGDSSSNANENTPEENIPSTNAGNSSSSSTERSSLETDPVKPSSVKTGSLTDERDGQTYKTVQIGNQIWMAENLKLEVSDGFCYGDVKDNCEKYGTFYTAKTALRICPDGWKLPNDEAWKILAQNIGAEYDISGRSGGGTFIYINDDAISKIRSTTGWSNTNGTNALGFSAYPAGKFNGTQYSGLGEQAVFMGSNKSSGEDASWAAISENQIYITGGKVTNSAMPVRCLQELPCDDSNNGEVEGATICEKGKWRMGTEAEIAVGFKNCSMENKNEIYNNHICEGYSWRKGTDAEIATNFKQCTLDNNGESVNNYTCIDEYWYYTASYLSLGAMSWEEAMSSCPEGWKIPSSSCDENSSFNVVHLYNNNYEYIDVGYFCGDGLNLDFFHWTSTEIYDSHAFAVIYSNSDKNEIAFAPYKTEKSASLSAPSTIVAICVKE